MEFLLLLHLPIKTKKSFTPTQPIVMKTPILFFVLLMGLFVGQAQERLIKGKVTDVQDNTGIPGVTIAIKGTSKGTQTDVNGNYQITVSYEKATLVFSYVGYVAKEVKVGKNNVLNVKLALNQQHLQEVVVAEPTIMMDKNYANAVAMPAPKMAMNGRMASSAGSSPRIKQRRIFDDSEKKEQKFDTEDYSVIEENHFQAVKNQPVTTFSIDVDRAAYSNVRRFITQGILPNKDAVRIEEMINYFDYQYPQPMGKDPVSISTELSDSPWNKDLKLLHIGLQAKKVATDNLPASNLVFLIDVSGSMSDENKLPLLISAFKLLVDQLREQDHVAIVVYAGAAGLVLPSTDGSQKTKIKDALDQLQAGGSTAGGAGIELAYKVAQEHFKKGGNNRIILATDGDFNVGASSDATLQRLIEEKRKTGVFLSTLGFGMGNYKDNKMETLADKGNGNYAYIDNLLEAQKVFVKEFGGTLFTVAKDVKLQLEFNPKYVKAYRLIGYENRRLNNEDFEDDKKDAGDMGSGHSVTAVYEIVPVGVESAYLRKHPELKYQEVRESANNSNEVCTIKIRYKKADGDKSELMEKVVTDQHTPLANTSDIFRFSASVAEFGLLLWNSEYKGKATFDQVTELAKKSLGIDEDGYRAEFIRLVKTAKLLKNNQKAVAKNEE